MTVHVSKLEVNSSTRLGAAQSASTISASAAFPSTPFGVACNNVGGIDCKLQFSICVAITAWSPPVSSKGMFRSQLTLRRSHKQ